MWVLVFIRDGSLQHSQHCSHLAKIQLLQPGERFNMEASLHEQPQICD